MSDPNPRGDPGCRQTARQRAGLSHKRVDGVLRTEESNPADKPHGAEQPAHGVGGTARGHHAADHREGQSENRVLYPVVVDPGVRLGQIEYHEEETECCKDQGERTHKPSEPGSGAQAHPTDSIPCSLVPSVTNTTLQHYRLLSVTKPSGERTSGNYLPSSSVNNERTARTFRHAPRSGGHSVGCPQAIADVCSMSIGYL